MQAPVNSLITVGPRWYGDSSCRAGLHCAPLQKRKRWVLIDRAGTRPIDFSGSDRMQTATYSKLIISATIIEIR